MREVFLLWEIKRGSGSLFAGASSAVWPFREDAAMVHEITVRVFHAPERYSHAVPDSPAVDGICCAAVSLELHVALHMTPLLVSIEESLGIGHAQATSLLLMQSAGFSSALAASGFSPLALQTKADRDHPIGHRRVKVGKVLGLGAQAKQQN